jgi:signal peptide peptidase SppA
MLPLVSLHYKLHHAAWYIRPDYFQSIKAAFEKLDFKNQSDMEDEAREFFSFFINQRPPVQIDSNGIAVITVSGILGNNLTPLEKLLGFTDYEDIQAELEQCQEEGAKALLLEIDSPGGEAQGALETAQRIAELELPKASYSAGLDASAAYFLSSSVDRKFVSPSAWSGSIGTILPWIDQTRLWDAFGISWEPVIGAGETFKGTGAGPELTDTDRVHLQGQVDAMSAVFREHVSNYRELDHAKLKAGAYFGKTAIDLNLADQIGSYDDAYQWLLNAIP